MELVLELFLFAPENDQAVRYHCLQQKITDRRRDPDDILAELYCAVDLEESSIRMAHSTSWRYEAGCTVLTYLAWVEGEGPQRLLTRRVIVNGIAPACSAGPLRPRPCRIVERDVLLHGLCHLRYLLLDHRDPVLRAALAESNAVGLLQNLSPAVAGRIGTPPPFI